MSILTNNALFFNIGLYIIYNILALLRVKVLWYNVDKYFVLENTMKIGFIGLGLIGGSIAKTLHRTRKDIELVAFARTEKNLLDAKNEGVINDYTTTFTGEYFADCDIIFLCAPVHTNVEYLPHLKKVLKKDTILTDVGSVKSEIHDMIRDFELEKWFIGGHPMAGTEKSGYSYATDRLLENAYYILTPEASVSSDKIELLKNLILDINSIPIVLSPSEHDYATAAISHLPHIIAYSLVNLVKDSDDKDGTMKLIAAGGFKDITRIASSSPEMWRQICMVNSSNISILLQKYIDDLVSIKEELDNASSAALLSRFETAKDYRDSFISASLGPIKKVFCLHCDLIDESGSLAAIATILAGNSISIKNIGIVHNREYIDGALRIEFYTENDLNNAVVVLKKYKYNIYLN